jgi:hypothetical protein
MTVTEQYYVRMLVPALQNLMVLFLAAGALVESHGAVHFERVRDGGIQPQVAVDSAGRTHLLYFKGDAMGGNLFYAVEPADGKGFGPAIKVNATPNSVLVAGTMRGPQMALGRDSVHVVWMGGNGAAKAKVGGENVTPLLYTRLSTERDGFEPERNILRDVAGLDGGQTVGADKKGNVYVVWHGAPPGTEGEEDRGLYIARSTNDGKAFAAETKVKVPKRGACACCGLRASVDERGALHVLFRAAEAGVNRSELWLKSEDFGKSFVVLKEDPWHTATCPASSAFLQVGGKFNVAAWETDNRVAGAILKGSTLIPLMIGGEKKQKHPTIATNDRGEVLVTWVEDAGWGTEGTLVCQMFDQNGKAIGETLRQSKLPPWSFGAPVAEAGRFTVYY